MGNNPFNERFSYISPSNWYYNYVMDIANAGITSGHPDGTYRPDADKKRSLCNYSLFEKALSSKD